MPEAAGPFFSVSPESATDCYGHSGMHYSLASRELIADMVETVAEAHQLMVLFCDELR